MRPGVHLFVDERVSLGRDRNTEEYEKEHLRIPPIHYLAVATTAVVWLWTAGPRASRNEVWQPIQACVGLEAEWQVSGQKGGRDLE